MGFRFGFVSGFGAGYYLGARAGRHRYEQINRTLSKARRSPVVETAAEKARTLVDRGGDDGSAAGSDASLPIVAPTVSPDLVTTDVVTTDVVSTGVVADVAADEIPVPADPDDYSSSR